MSKAFKCDKCKKFYEREKENPQKIHIEIANVKYDVCQECEQELLDMFGYISPDAAPEIIAPNPPHEGIITHN